MAKANPHCPVPGCKTDKPHSADPAVDGLIEHLADPVNMTFWVLAGMTELRDSIVRDLKDQQVFAWFSRLRQPEELYVRTLYALLIADEKELHHILSGDMPNGFSGIYEKVNEVIFEGRGRLKTEQAEVGFGSFTAMDTLNDGAHVSFAGFTTCISIAQNPECIGPDYIERYHKHLTQYCDFLRYMHGMFQSGKAREHVLEGVRSLHKPTSHWKEQQEKIRQYAKQQESSETRTRERHDAQDEC